MLGLLFLLLLAAPVVDLYLLYRIAQEWGFLPAVGLVLGTAALGLAVGRAQGTRMIAGLGRELVAGRPPGRGALNGLAVLGGAFLLVMPGPLGDALGVALLLPPTRWLLLAAARRSLERAAASGALRVSVLRWRPGAAGPEPSDGTIGLDPRNEILSPGERPPPR